MIIEYFKIFNKYFMSIHFYFPLTLLVGIFCEYNCTIYESRKIVIEQAKDEAIAESKIKSKYELG